MKLILGIFTFVCFGQTIFSENIGTTTTPATIAISANTFQNTSFTFTGSADTRTSTPSSGYTGASGSRNVFFTNTIGRNFIISGINTTVSSLLTLSFGHFKSTNASSNELLVEVSSDGITYTSLSYTRPTGTGTSNWTLITTTGSMPSTSNLRIRFTNNSSTAQFRIDDIILTYQSPLPITLMSFTAEKRDNYNLLEWSTASEINNDYFLLERSTDGINWNVINKTLGAGNSNNLINYSFTDYNFESVINYYRLTQVDYNGASETFNITYANNTKKSKKVIRIINTSGQEVPIESKGILIITYEDGSSIRIMN